MCSSKEILHLFIFCCHRNNVRRFWLFECRTIFFIWLHFFLLLFCNLVGVIYLVFTTRNGGCVCCRCVIVTFWRCHFSSKLLHYFILEIQMFLWCFVFPSAYHFDCTFFCTFQVHITFCMCIGRLYINVR